MERDFDDVNQGTKAQRQKGTKTQRHKDTKAQRHKELKKLKKLKN